MKTENDFTIKNALKHFKKICIHKWWVFYYCCQFGLYWRGIKHDMSKFSPTEFIESVRYYEGTRSPIDKCKEVNGYSRAWQHHKGRNNHHYEYWTDRYDDGTVVLCMSFLDTMEMLCDYLGAGRAYNGEKFTHLKELDWWKGKLEKGSSMNPVQKEFITWAFTVMYETGTLPARYRCLQKYDELVAKLKPEYIVY